MFSEKKRFYSMRSLAFGCFLDLYINLLKQPKNTISPGGSATSQDFVTIAPGFECEVGFYARGSQGFYDTQNAIPKDRTKNGDPKNMKNLAGEK